MGVWGDAGCGGLGCVAIMPRSLLSVPRYSDFWELAGGRGELLGAAGEKEGGRGRTWRRKLRKRGVRGRQGGERGGEKGGEEV